MNPLNRDCTPFPSKGVHLHFSCFLLYPNYSNLPEKHRVFVEKTRCFSLFYELLQKDYCVLACFAKEKYAVFPYVFPYGILNRLHAFVECLYPAALSLVVDLDTWQ